MYTWYSAIYIFIIIPTLHSLTRTYLILAGDLPDLVAQNHGTPEEEQAVEKGQSGSDGNGPPWSIGQVNAEVNAANFKGRRANLRRRGEVLKISCIRLNTPTTTGGVYIDEYTYTHILVIYLYCINGAYTYQLGSASR